ncbi:hypothetical protein O2V63_07215 [Modestobacter sp. VKM Ac-2977]|uniref:hypothetical protein n=1 Tax=Modestobacter sp. VKM Ac-2977 TaxID=3004131 RepID=UPI0022AA163D|nr:hypothetical protein [Modestobacter sp. VKM Ac-2977]MCZ2820111.1 hypothetical protein [Modestobacter sp. VKM Ac-2977]
MDPTSACTGPAETDDDPRWAQALARAARAPSTSARPRLLTWSWVLALTVLALAGALLVAVLSTDALVPDPGPSGGWEDAGLVVQGAGLAVMVGYGFVAWRTGLFQAAWWQPTAVLSWAQRRRLLAQVRGRAAVDPARLPLARAQARRLVLQRDQLLLLVGVLVQQLGRAIGDPTQSTVAFTALATVVLLAVAGLLWRQARRAERFLADHPDPGFRG